MKTRCPVLRSNASGPIVLKLILLRPPPGPAQEPIERGKTVSKLSQSWSNRDREVGPNLGEFGPNRVEHEQKLVQTSSNIRRKPAYFLPKSAQGSESAQVNIGLVWPKSAKSR